MTTPHLVLTRLMIGVARPTAFMRHAQTMLETLYPSLAAQTEGDFHWAVVTDSLIDGASEQVILDRFAAHPNFHLEKIDPFAAGHADMPVAALCERHLGTARNVITTRIDDDDALRLDFLVEVRRRIDEARASNGEDTVVSCSFSKGVRLVPRLKRYDFHSAPSGASAGMSVFSRNAAKTNVHSFGHNKAHQRVVGKGGVAIHLDTDEPYYLTGVHPGSASREKRSVEDAERRIRRRYKACAPDDPTYVALMASFGLPANIADRIADVGERFADPRPLVLEPLDGQAHFLMTRTQTKSAYLTMAKRLKTRAEVDGRTQYDEHLLDLHLLRQAYYSL